MEYSETEKLILRALENEELEIFTTHPHASEEELDRIMRGRTTKFIRGLWVDAPEEHH